MKTRKSKGEPTALANSQYKDHPKTGWDIDGKGKVVGKGIEITGIRYAVIKKFNNNEHDLQLVCSCKNEDCLNANHGKKTAYCKPCRIVAYERGR